MLALLRGAHSHLHTPEARLKHLKQIGIARSRFEK